MVGGLEVSGEAEIVAVNAARLYLRLHAFDTAAGNGELCVLIAHIDCLPRFIAPHLNMRLIDTPPCDRLPHPAPPGRTPPPRRGSTSPIPPLLSPLG